MIMIKQWPMSAVFSLLLFLPFCLDCFFFISFLSSYQHSEAAAAATTVATTEAVVSFCSIRGGQGGAAGERRETSISDDVSCHLNLMNQAVAAGRVLLLLPKQQNNPQNPPVERIPHPEQQQNPYSVKALDDASGGWSRVKRSPSSGGSDGVPWVKCPQCDFWGYKQADGSLVQNKGPVGNTRGKTLGATPQRVVHRIMSREKLSYHGTFRTVEQKCDVQHEMENAGGEEQR